jgi:hypothetical protein
VSAGVDQQFAGDGAAETATVLDEAGPAIGTLPILEGPSQATVRNLVLQIGDYTGLRVAGCDQPGGPVFADQLHVVGSAPDGSAPPCGSPGSRAGVPLRGLKCGSHGTHPDSPSREKRLSNPIP